MQVPISRILPPVLLTLSLAACGSGTHENPKVPTLSTTSSTTSPTANMSTRPSLGKDSNKSGNGASAHGAETAQHATQAGTRKDSGVGVPGAATNDTDASGASDSAKGGSANHGAAAGAANGASRGAQRSSSSTNHGLDATTASSTVGQVAQVESNGKAGSGSPTAIGIPSLGLNRSVVPISPANGVLSPPSWQVSWDAQTPTPGSAGTSVILGHVTENGPDVFYTLHTLTPGATVTLRQSNGGTSTWRVSMKYSINKDTAQRDTRIWRTAGTPMLALVTCDAESAWVGGGHHANNYVILLTKS